MQYRMIWAHTTSEWHLQCDSISVTWICRNMSILGYSSIVHRNNQPILASLDPYLSGGVWESDVR